MNTPTDPIHDAHDTDARRPTLAQRVQAALDGLRVQLGEVHATRPTTDADHAQRCAVLALLHARRAGWWAVFHRGVIYSGVHGDAAVTVLLVRASLIAWRDAQDRARFWRNTASDWRARAEGRPTSDAAGALSNWHELGVTA